MRKAVIVLSIVASSLAFGSVQDKPTTDIMDCFYVNLENLQFEGLPLHKYKNHGVLGYGASGLNGETISLSLTNISSEEGKLLGSINFITQDEQILVARFTFSEDAKRGSKSVRLNCSK